MANVTICIPSYRTGSFIQETLRSVQRQSYTDLTVEIGLEPPIEDTIEAINPFLVDRRFLTTVNSSRLGWDANIRQLLQRVATPYFVILPHDDILHPDYIATLLPVLERRPDASVAYGDMFVFGSCDPYFKMLDLPADGTIKDRLFAFFLGGAEAVPWRGVTRSAVIGRGGGFPTDGFAGFAVECEWALTLLLQGPAVRVPRPMYFKRVHPMEVMTASRARIMDFSREQLAAAWAGHRKRMLDPLAAFGRTSLADRILHLAAEFAMLRRKVQVLGGAPTSEALAEAQFLLSALDDLSMFDQRARRLQSTMRLEFGLLSDVGTSGQNETAELQNDDAICPGPSSADALVSLGQLRLRECRVFEALDLAAQAFTAAPHSPGISALLAGIAVALPTAESNRPLGKALQ